MPAEFVLTLKLDSSPNFTSNRDAEIGCIVQDMGSQILNGDGNLDEPDGTDIVNRDGITVGSMQIIET